MHYTIIRCDYNHIVCLCGHNPGSIYVTIIILYFIYITAKASVSPCMKTLKSQTFSQNNQRMLWITEVYKFLCINFPFYVHADNISTLTDTMHSYFVTMITLGNCTFWWKWYSNLSSSQVEAICTSRFVIMGHISCSHYNIYLLQKED